MSAKSLVFKRPPLFVLEIQQYKNCLAKEKQKDNPQFDRVGSNTDGIIVHSKDNKEVNVPGGASNGGFIHIGYVNKIFETPEAAAEFYDNLNKPSGMRSLNQHGMWASDWHPQTKLRFVVRAYGHEALTYPASIVEPPPADVVVNGGQGTAAASVS
jgi:hypothetical protein